MRATMKRVFQFNTRTAPSESFVDVEVILCDTSLLAPAGHQSLEALGNVIGLPKRDVGGFITQMDKLLIEDSKKFCEYAITDSVIALTYWVGVHLITRNTIGPKLFHTVGSIAIGYFNKYLKE